ncbi:hypothetical protein, partial [Burkholderia gladioli]|uniref:hypothetical protein n=1 Tax=Burkholderia gladioli TaxID=28095 RepID=UPI0022D6B6F9
MTLLIEICHIRRKCLREVQGKLISVNALKFDAEGGLKNQVQRFINFWATSSLSIASAGVFQSSVCLGRPFINLAM